MIKWLLDQNPFREIYLSYNQIESGLFPGMKLVPYGLVSKGYPEGQEPVLDEARANFIWGNLRLRYLQDPAFPVGERTQSLIVRDYAVFRNGLGIYYEDLGDDAKAKITPRSKAADLLRMDHYYEECFANFKWAALWNPQDAQFSFNLGNACVHLGRFTEAQDWYEKATRLNPHYASAYFNWAVTALQAGNSAKAKELFGKVVELQPDNAQARKGLEMLNNSGH
jgi:tetratricopeptide (TPR) repeat protein